MDGHGMLLPMDYLRTSVNTNVYSASASKNAAFANVLVASTAE